MKIHVEGFGKIKSADINLGDLTLFIGENNSGKTYLMQLIYQVLESLTNLKNIDQFLDGEEFTCINSSNWKQINDAVNRWLRENKNKIVERAFLNSFPIEELSVDLDEIDGEYLLQNDFVLSQDDIDLKLEHYNRFEITHNGVGLVKHFLQHPITVLQKNNAFVSEVIRDTINSQFKRRARSLFIPASRSGLMLVYRNFPSQSRSHSYVDLAEKREKNNLGFTKPVCDYLEFLLTYHFEPGDDRQKKIVDFISNNIIDGTLNIENNAILYKPNSSNEYFPAHLSSSMVNEIAPIVMMLTNWNDYGHVFYDEIETCLHPLKQIEMARLTARLVNNNYKMILSTHSDTMAIALNNLIMLSQTKDRNAMAKKLSYNEDDFFNTDNIHLYQLKSVNGEMIVSEIKMYPNINIGYDFELFNMSNDKLYNDAKTIMGGFR